MALPATDDHLLRELYATHAGVLLGYVRDWSGGDTARAEDVAHGMAEALAALSAFTDAVLQGPAAAPLAAVTVKVDGGNIVAG